MSVSIQLSLAGDGRLVILTPETVRKAFFQFSKVNPEYTGREKYKLNYPLANGPVSIFKYTKKRSDRRWISGKYNYCYERLEATVLDALHRSYLDREDLSYLHPQDILRVERQINKYIVDYDLGLVEDEGMLLDGYVNCKKLGQSQRKVKYIRRYGMFFILEQISIQNVIKMQNVDLFIQDRETYDFHLVHYQGVILSSLKSRIKLLFGNRLDFSRTWTWTLDEFQPRQIFMVKEIYPCPGFEIINWG